MKAVAALPLALLALPAMAETDYSALIRDRGLSGARDTLETIAAPTPSDRFALGGVLFLGAIERALQTRWQVALSDSTLMQGLPVLRLPIPENPAPQPFDPAVIESLFATMEDDLATAIATLAPITDDADLAVTISTGDIWFDVNMNATRDPGEGFGDVAGSVMQPAFEPATPAPDITIRFDTADAAWLSAYAHMLSAVSQGALALSPTEAITRVIATRDAMQAFSPGEAAEPGMPDAGTMVDTIAIILRSIEQRPDPARTAALRDHLLALIADNRDFWRRVARETDNDAEWIPNKRQTSALPLDFPPQTGERWLAILADAEGVLKGDLLIPYWRLPPDAGINLARLLADPPELDIIGLIQGETLLPYMQKGRRADADNLLQFEELVSGNAGLFVLVLN
jgi:hypothetical protein